MFPKDMEDDVPYNPKNLPLGWDGKPIPYWLYKLHGLNISYKCEICANYTYKVCVCCFFYTYKPSLFWLRNLLA